MERYHSFKRLIATRFQKALSSYEDNALAQKEAVKELIDNLLNIIPKGTIIPQVLEIGCGTGLLSRKIVEVFQIKNYTLNDLFEDAITIAKEQIEKDTTCHLICQDAETLDLPKEQYNLIVSSSAIQWFKNPPLFFDNMSKSLAKDGLLAISTYAPGTMKEFSTLTGKGLIYPKIEELKEMLSKKYDLLKMYQREIVIPFDSPYEVLKHIKHTGVSANNTLEDLNFWTPSKLKSFVNQYQNEYKIEGTSKVSLTYKPIFILAKHKKKLASH